jgi:hypothetical protein
MPEPDMVFRRPAGRDSGLSLSSCMCHHLTSLRKKGPSHACKRRGRPGEWGAQDPCRSGLWTMHACVMRARRAIIPLGARAAPITTAAGWFWPPRTSPAEACACVVVAAGRCGPSCMACPIRSSSSSWATGLAFLCVVATVWE